MILPTLCFITIRAVIIEQKGGIPGIVLYYIKCLLVHTKAESAENFLWLTMLILPMFVLPVLILPIFVLPVSVHGVQWRLFIDIEEATFTLKATNQTAVYGHMSLHVRKSGHWTSGKKVTVLCGIEAGNQEIHESKQVRVGACSICACVCRFLIWCLNCMCK